MIQRHSVIAPIHRRLVDGKFYFTNFTKRRGENRSTRRKTSQNKRENQQRTQPTYDARIQTWATLVALGCSHHCAFASLVPQLTIAYVRYINSNAFLFGFLCGQVFFGNYQTNIVNILQFFSESLLVILEF